MSAPPAPEEASAPPPQQPEMDTAQEAGPATADAPAAVPAVAPPPQLSEAEQRRAAAERARLARQKRLAKFSQKPSASPTPVAPSPTPTAGAGRGGGGVSPATSSLAASSSDGAAMAVDGSETRPNPTASPTPAAMSTAPSSLAPPASSDAVSMAASSESLASASSSPSKQQPLYVQAHHVVGRLFRVSFLDEDDERLPSITSASPRSGAGSMTGSRLSGVSGGHSGPSSFKGRGPASADLVALPNILRDLEDLEARGNTIDEATVVDLVLNARLYMDTAAQPNGFQLCLGFAYLVETYKRAADSTSDFSARSKHRKLVDTTMSMCGRFLRTCLQVPGVYPEQSGNEDVSRQLIGRLLSSGDQGIDTYLVTLLMDLCEADKDDPEALQQIFLPVLAGLRAEVATKTLLDKASPAINALLQLSSRPAIAAMIVEQESWIPDTKEGRHFELASFMGPFLRPTTVPDLHHASPFIPLSLPPYSGQSYFPRMEDGRANRSDIEAAHTSVRRTLQLMRKSLHEIFKNLLLRIKPGEDKAVRRARVVQYLATALEQNSKRAQLRADRSRLASDGFMINLCSVLCKLCEPIANHNKPGFSKIDHSYPIHPERKIDLSQETRLAAQDEAVDEWVKAHPNPAPYNFSTEVFFLTLHAVHVGTLPALLKYMNEWASSRGRVAAAQSELQAAERANVHELPQYREALRRVTVQRLCFEAEALNPDMLLQVTDVLSFVGRWLVHLVDPNGKGLPLSEEVPMPFAALPEYIVEDCAELLTLTARFAPDIVDRSVGTVHLVRFLLMFLGSRAYVTNPYLRAKLVELLALFSPERLNKQGRSRFFDFVQTDPVAIEHLGPSLMQFYVDVEDTDFYAKLSMRNNAQVILKHLWAVPTSRQGIVAATERPQFVRFIMFLINDTTFLLDEARDAMKRIQELRRKQTTAEWQAKPEEEKDEDLAYLERTQEQARSLVQLADDTISMFSYLTEEVTAPFMKEELVARLAYMLNYNVMTLVGHKAADFQVDDPEAYGYNPQKLMLDLADIYLNLSRAESADQFVAAISGDGRSYSVELMDKTAHVLSRLRYPEGKGNEFQAFFARVKEAYVTAAKSDQDLGDIPDEFTDPLMCTLMRFPVRLPSSGVVVDRATIVTHLLSDPTDPFNRSPLAVEDLVEDKALKERIEAWVAKVLADKQGAAQ